MAKKKNQNLGKTGVILIAVLLIGSTLAIGLSSLGDDDPEIIKDKDKFEYEGYTFYYDSIENTYSIFAQIENNQIIYDVSMKDVTTRFAFREDPRNLSDIPLDIEAVTKILSASKIYLAYNPNENNISKIAISGIEIARFTGNVYKIPTVEA